ncbi:MAG: PTS transporter subunit EIIC [Erysipelotrichaceae bacterium]|jgi:PTS system cellobiose-specific IIC component|nr:PTS transporter subunit EIIC [Erysipelotrichaceae bacterium]
MKKFINWLETSFAPRLNKISHLSWVVILKDSVNQILPFILLGTVFCVLAILNDYIPGLPSFWEPFGWTMGKVSLFVSFLVPFNYCERKRLRKQRLIAGLTGIVFFLICSTPITIADGEIGFGTSALGAGGMFVAIITGVLTSLVFGMVGRFSFFKEDSAIPEFVRNWFDQMLPVFVVVTAAWLVVLIANVDLFTIILNLFMPIQNFLNTWYGFIAMNFFICFIYSMGISSWVLTPVTQPVKLASIAANLSMVAAGTFTAATANMFTEGLIYVTYMWVGGIACTLPLVYLMMASKVKKIKALGRACFIPGLFNINEPVIFGAIAWNPIMMLPMWLQGIIIPAITWIACKVIAFAPIPKIQFEMWYLPYPLGTWISTGSIVAILFLAFSFFLSGLIWYPFFKVYEKQELEIELQEDAKS